MSKTLPISRLQVLTNLSLRRLEEDVLTPLVNKILPTPMIGPMLELVSIQSAKTKKLINIPTDWLVDLGHRVNAMTGLGVAPAPLLSADLREAAETASKVVLDLWTPLRTLYDLDYSRSLDCILDSILWYIPMCGRDQQFIPFLKFNLAYLFAKGENQDELPERPEGLLHKSGCVLNGHLGKFFKNRCFGSSARNKEFRNTVIQGVKKGMPQMGDFHLRKNLVAMKDRLSVIAETPDYLLSEVTRTSTEMFPDGIGKSDWDVVQPHYSPSDHASFEKTRSQGGVLFHLRELDTPENEESHSKLLSDELASMYWDPASNFIGEIRWPSWTCEHIYSSLQEFSVQACLGRKGKAKAKPIFEPFKVRMISAGDIISNGLFGNLQKLLWKRMQRYRQFILTGKSVQNDDVIQLQYDSLVSIGSGYFKWVSGDYSAATDTLNSDATRAAVVALSRDEATKAVILRGLQSTQIDFDSIEMEDVPEPFEMKNGQLMGCVFSFPILCIVNLAVYRYALEQTTGERYTIDQLPCLVNGDDILFMTNDLLYTNWCEAIKGVGFKRSVGKNYVSENFAMINSCYFSTVPGRKIKKIPYLNMGWCTGVSKGGSGNMMKGDHEDDDKSILRIRSQVLKTEFDWVIDPDTSKPKYIARRKEIVERFKDEIHSWNWTRIVDSCVSIDEGPAGLGLKDTRNKFWKLWAYVLDKVRDKPISYGISSISKSMTPWKAMKGKPIEDNFRPFYQKFHRQNKFVEDRTLMNEVFDYYINQLRIQGNDFLDERMSVGAFPTSTCLKGFLDRPHDFDGYDSEYFDRMRYEVSWSLRQVDLESDLYDLVD